MLAKKLDLNGWNEQTHIIARYYVYFFLKERKYKIPE